MKRLLFFIAIAFMPFLTIAQEQENETTSGQDTTGLDYRVNEAFQPIADWWESFVLTPIPFSDDIQIPFVVLLLVFGAVFAQIIYGTGINVLRSQSCQ